MKPKKYSTIIILTIMFVVAFSLRIYKLGKSPEAFTWDEAALSYNSYSLLKTGADEYGYKFPLVLRSFDDYKPALYAYLSIPFIYLFGLSIFSTRLLSVVAGSSLIFSMYLLGKNITGKKSVGLLASLFSISMPLFLHYSRIALEANLSLALYTAGLANVTKKDNLKSFYVGSILLILSAYAYHSPRYLVPIVFITALIFSLKKTSLKKKCKIAAFCLIPYLPILYFVLAPRFNRRFEETSIFTRSGVLSGSIVKLPNTGFPFSMISRGYFYILDFFGRFLGYFNPYSLFVSISGHELYHVDGLGVFNLFELPLWIIGMYQLLKRPKKFHPILIVGIIFSAIPATMTVDWFSPIRALLLWPLYLVVSATGASYLIDFVKRNIKLLPFAFFYTTLWFFFSARTIETSLIFQPYYHSGAYQYGFAQVVPYVDDLVKKNNYDQVLVDSPHAQPHIFFLAFSKYPPEKYQKEIQWRVNDFSPRTNFDFGPYTFRKIKWGEDQNLKNTLFVGNLTSLPYDEIKYTKGAKILKEFHGVDGSITFRVVQNP
jgi:4-amino-4-deoxy-L-arabinose transferase-like glycosyltransferase